jgi:membrane protease subunit (stomatin/prohibitin family)
MEQIVPGITEEVLNVRRAGRRMATTFGLNEGDLNTEDEANAVRQNRQQMQQAAMQMEAMQAAGKTLKDASSKPEAGSPAENILAQMGV